MSEDILDQQPQQKSEVDINALVAAKERIESGTATPEDEAMVQGFEAGATAAHELRGLDERIVADDLLAPTEQEISRLQAEVVTEKAWGEDTSQLETKLQGHEDMKAYLETRDYQDKNGSVHDAESGKFVSPNDANEGDTKTIDNVFSETQESEDTYNNLSIDELTTKWAEAEDNNDKTTSLNVQNEIQQRLLDENKTDGNGKGMSEDLKMRLIDRVHANMVARRKNNGNATHDGALEEGKSVKVSAAQSRSSEVPQAIEAPLKD